MNTGLRKVVSAGTMGVLFIFSAFSSRSQSPVRLLSLPDCIQIGLTHATEILKDRILWNSQLLNCSLPTGSFCPTSFLGAVTAIQAATPC